MLEENLHQPKIENYLKKILEEFTNLENKNIAPEYEFKVFLDGIDDKDKILEIHNNIQNKIINELNGKIIFDGKIEDTRYYDTKNKDTSILNENNISMVRIREQQEKDGRKEFIYTVKERDDYTNLNKELEEEVGDNFGKKVLEEQFGLQEIKKSSKKRKEIEFEIEFYKKGKKQIEKVKVAFDEYTDKNNENIPPFFEVEAVNKEVSELGYKKIKELFPNLKFKETTTGAKNINKEIEREELIEDLLSKNIKGLIGNIVESIINLLENQTIYKTIDNFEKNNFTYNDNLKTNFFELLEKQLEKSINENHLLGKFFYRIISNENVENDSRKKFQDKFEREYSGYMKVFLLSIIDDYKNVENKITRNLKNIILNKLDSFLKTIFMFDDSLTREELASVLELDQNTIKKHFNIFQDNILLILGEQNVHEIWKEENNQNTDKLSDKEKGNLRLREKLEGGANGRVLNRFITSYSRANASVIQKGGEVGNIEIIEKKFNSLKNQQFQYLSKQFSQWLNSPDRDLSRLQIIKNLFLENSYHLYLFKKTILKDENIKFDDEFIEKVINSKKDILFDKNNFQVKQKGPELFKDFLEDINLNIKNNSKKIIKKFQEFNKNFNKKILKNKNELQIKKSQEISNSITFENWQNLKFEARMKIFYSKILRFNTNGFALNNNFNDKNIFSRFCKYEFEKNTNLRFINGNNLTEEEKSFNNKYKSELNKFTKIVDKQLKTLRNYFEKNKIKSFSKKYKIKHLARNDINSFNLLVSLFQFNLKAQTKGKNPEELTLYSQIYAEKVLEGIGDKILNDNNFEFITSTSSNYNTSAITNDRIIELHDRIGNDKSINVGEHFDFIKDSKYFMMKDFPVLYSKGNYKQNRKFLEKAIETTRGLLNDDMKNIDNNYLEILEKIGFPIKEQKYLKKLLEFLKYIYKIVSPYINEINNNSKNKTNDFATKIFDTIKYIESNNCKIAENKSYPRMLEKSIIKYGGNLEEIADGTRATIFADTFEELAEKTSSFVKELYNGGDIKSIRFEDKIGNIFKKAGRLNGYRDATLAITDDNGNTIEVQFQLRDFYDIKTGDLQISDNKKIIFKNQEYDILEKLKNELSIKNNDEIFTLKEKQEIVDFINITGGKIPNSFINLFNIEIDSEFIGKKFNADYTYNLERTLGQTNKNIDKKLKILDRILFDIANGIVAKKELERVL